ncbi:uncharacterized protein LOC101058161 [Pan troglodytes]|uniref:uncharacterized protein LOC101058161 n=1 Tax=Pan troglodytes TaxID=9598 RepID=UPI0023F4F044|nr:uncharacterized protein LOC101058161 [Pan troglodytes]
MYGPCLPDTRLLATRHRLRHLDLTQSPCAAGRRGFIICDMPADSPAQSGDRSHHRHLLVPALACPPESRIKLSRPTEIYGPILLSLNSHSSRKLRPLRADARSGSAATTVSSQGTKSAERKSRSTGQARGGHRCPVAAPASLSHHPSSVRPVCQGWHCPGKW